MTNLNIQIPRPSILEVNTYLAKWGNLENYFLQESSLTKLYTKTYPTNIDLDDVLIKVCALNDFYSTNIFSPFTVAKHIISLNIDKFLESEDLTIVNKIAEVKMSGDKVRNFYSFATKYCSHHKPNTYPIYDYYVEMVLIHFKKLDQFYNFSKEDLKDFPKFKTIIEEFRAFYGLEKYPVKDIDKYLWQVGKEYFPKNYAKVKGKV